MPAQNEGQTNRLLGYPEDARLLIINADDFGMCHAVNATITDALTRGAVSSTSLMVPCPWAPHAMRFLRDHPELPFAVHLTLTCDFTTYRWGPVVPWDRVPTLVDANDHFRLLDERDALLAGARLDEVELEFRSQIETVLRAGMQPSHLDWHCLADGGREDIFALTLALATSYGLALRVHEREHAGAIQRKGLPVVDHPVLASYRLAPEEKRARYIQLLRELPAGLSEWAVHPGLGDAEAQALEPDSWQVRRADYDFFLSPSVQGVIEEEGIIVLDYRTLQAVWAS